MLPSEKIIQPELVSQGNEGNGVPWKRICEMRNDNSLGAGERFYVRLAESAAYAWHMPWVSGHDDIDQFKLNLPEYRAQVKAAYDGYKGLIGKLNEVGANIKVATEEQLCDAVADTAECFETCDSGTGNWMKTVNRCRSEFHVMFVPVGISTDAMERFVKENTNTISPNVMKVWELERQRRVSVAEDGDKDRQGQEGQGVKVVFMTDKPNVSAHDMNLPYGGSLGNIRAYAQGVAELDFLTCALHQNIIGNEGDFVGEVRRSVYDVNGACEDDERWEQALWYVAEKAFEWDEDGDFVPAFTAPPHFPNSASRSPSQGRLMGSKNRCFSEGDGDAI